MIGRTDGRSADELRALGHFPNPATSGASLRFDLRRAVAVRVTLYDVLGREVKQLAGGFFRAGSHEVRIDASELTSGVYTYRLVAGRGTATRALIVAR
ncbi:MAG: T9SS type A sorting domain-containing protein [Rhodothermales bacterium]|nr:T9SS type A sorting domain-containing protein [Rhodothermales bacterium]